MLYAAGQMRVPWREHPQERHEVLYLDTYVGIETHWVRLSRGICRMCGCVWVPGVAFGRGAYDGIYHGEPLLFEEPVWRTHRSTKLDSTIQFPNG
ncbi:MAG: hypothetical protein BWY17_00575 [Deltaproteobacteria bacterium ADurb.Bin207]|nr:MAG: hypothetical protein BWY17_00575 [Deltaproteobacteria bacterium ADurb.Bin207]